MPGNFPSEAWNAEVARSAHAAFQLLQNFGSCTRKKFHVSSFNPNFAFGSTSAHQVNRVKQRQAGCTADARFWRRDSASSGVLEWRRVTHRTLALAVADQFAVSGASKRIDGFRWSFAVK